MLTCNSRHGQIFFSALALLIVEQYILPLLTNALPPLEANNVPLILERLLKLVLPFVFDASCGLSFDHDRERAFTPADGTDDPS